MKSNFSRPLRFHSWTSSKLAPRKKLQRPKLKKSETAPWKWHFSPHDFLGLQQSLCNINFSFGIFMSKYQRKKFATKMHHGDCRIKKWSILMTSFWQQFSHSKQWFLAETNYTRKFLHLLGMRWAKKFAIIFDDFRYTKETLSAGWLFFSRSTLFNKSFS